MRAADRLRVLAQARKEAAHCFVLRERPVGFYVFLGFVWVYAAPRRRPREPILWSGAADDLLARWKATHGGTP